MREKFEDIYDGSSYDPFRVYSFHSAVKDDTGLAIRIIKDLNRAIAEDENITYFSLIHNSRDVNRNPCVVTIPHLGMASWVLPYVTPVAHKLVVEGHKLKWDMELTQQCINYINLVFPDERIAWNRRREFVSMLKERDDEELRINNMALSANPSCAETYKYRRWLLANKRVLEDDASRLESELEMTLKLAGLHKNNYHAWEHRQWCLRNLSREPLPSLESPFSAAQLLSVRWDRRALFKVYVDSPITDYIEDMVQNGVFMDEHITDHSGFHHRTFLFDLFFSFLLDEKMHADFHDPSILASYNGDEMDFKERITSFFESKSTLAVKEYLDSLQDEPTVLEVIIHSLLQELNANDNICAIYDCHEASLYFRRYIVTKLVHFTKKIESESPSLFKLYLDQICDSEKFFIEGNFESTSCDQDTSVLINYSKFLNRLMRRERTDEFSFTPSSM